MTDLELRHPETCRGECAQRIHIVETSGRVYRGAAAGRGVLRRLPAGWLWALPQNPRRGDRAPCRREGLAIDLAEQVDPEDRRPIRDRLVAILAFMLVSWTSNYRETMTSCGQGRSNLCCGK